MDADTSASTAEPRTRAGPGRSSSLYRPAFSVCTLGLLLLPAACGEAPEAPEIRAGPELRVAQVPLPEELAGERLFQVVGLAVIQSSEGDPVVAIADSGNYRVVFWWPERGRVEHFGRDGEGPGEFGTIMSVWAAGEAVLVADARSLVLVAPGRGEIGRMARELGNLLGGDAFLPEGYFAAPVDDTSSDPFEFRRLEMDGSNGELVPAERPAWFPAVTSVERPVHPAYVEAGLEFPPLLPVSEGLLVSLGTRAVWVDQRNGQLIILPFGSPVGAEPSPPWIAPVPASLVTERASAWVAELGESGMMQRAFPVFWPTRPDASGRRALFPVPLSRGDPLGWLLGSSDDGELAGRVVRLREGEELEYPVRAALPLPDGAFLVGHEGGLTLLREYDG